MESKVLFLDIDGVLVTFKCFNRFSKVEFDPVAVKQLNRILEETDVKVVISSSWRHSWKLSELLNYFRREGINITDERCLGITDDLPDRPRGDEIHKWVIEHRPKKIVIIDDDDDMSHVQSALFKTDTTVGLTPAIAQRVIDHLN
jgi:hypothetical protein